LAQFHSSLSQFLSPLGCGHTYLFPTSFAKKKLKQENDLPFDIDIFNDSILITKIYVNGDEKYIGATITEINNISAFTFLKSAYKITSSDAYNTTYKKYLISRPSKTL